MAAQATTPAKKDPKIPLWVKLMVGSVAGVIGTSVVFPLDFIKTQLQEKKGVYKGPIDCARQIYAREGFFGFYDGLKLNLFGVIFEKALKLAVNEYIKEKLEDKDGNVSVPNQVIAGATAGFAQAIFTNPMEVSKIWMQVQNKKPPAERLTSMQVVQKLGLSGLYTATYASVARDMPFSVVFFPLYSYFQSLTATVDPDTKKKTNSVASNLISGTLAGSIAAGLVTPMDMLKTRLQKPDGIRDYKNMIYAYRMVVEKDGYAALYSGATPRMMVVGPLFGVTMLCFEKLKIWYREKQSI